MAGDHRTAAPTHQVANRLRPTLSQKEPTHDQPVARSAGALDGTALPFAQPATVLALQRTIGNAAVRRWLQRHPRAGNGPPIQRAVDTMGGSWETTQYDLTTKEPGKWRGVDIRLEFDPKDPVDATKIGLTQAVKTHKNSATYITNNNATLNARTVPDDKPGAGYRTDRLKERGNPIYGTDYAASLADSTFSGQKAVDNQVGWHYRDDAKKLVHQKAKLYDTPNLKDAAKNSGHTFETTALAVDGNQAGTYYGSVRWGYQTDNDGNHTKLPLEIITFGVPSADFVQSAKRWNVTPTAGGNNPLALPVNFVSVSVEVKFRSRAGQNLFITGDTPELGSWDPAKAFALKFLGPETWGAEVNLNANKGGKELQYKYLVKEGANVRWEEGANHKQTLPAAGASGTVRDTWHEQHMGH